MHPAACQLVAPFDFHVDEVDDHDATDCCRSLKLTGDLRSRFAVGFQSTVFRALAERVVNETLSSRHHGESPRVGLDIHVAA